MSLKESRMVGEALQGQSWPAPGGWIFGSRGSFTLRLDGDVPLEFHESKHTLLDLLANVRCVLLSRGQASGLSAGPTLFVRQLRVRGAMRYCGRVSLSAGSRTMLTVRIIIFQFV